MCYLLRAPPDVFPVVVVVVEVLSLVVLVLPPPFPPEFLLVVDVEDVVLVLEGLAGRSTCSTGIAKARADSLAASRPMPNIALTKNSRIDVIMVPSDR